MKIILNKIWDFLKQKNRWAIALVVVLLLVGSGIFKLQRDRIAELKKEKQQIENLNHALNDSINYYQNRHNEWVAEKATIQETIKNLEKMYGQLTNSQRELIQRIKELDKKNSIITAALFDANVKIDSLLAKDKERGGVVTVDTTKKMFNINNLASKDSTFIYDIDVNHVLPAYPDLKPSLLFKSIEIPNKQFVEFHWKNDKKRGYPISCSVTNTNPYVKITNLNSYAIPPLDKVKLNPTGWQKIGNFFVKNGKTIFCISAGVAAGAGGYYILTR